LENTISNNFHKLTFRKYQRGQIKWIINKKNKKKKLRKEKKLMIKMSDKIEESKKNDWKIKILSVKDKMEKKNLRRI
jgi:hypothetical protein